MDYSITSGGGVQPNAYECGTKTTWGWGLEDFLPKPGKTVGIWPYEFTISNLTTLRTHWGYSGIFVNQNNYNIAISAGYSYQNMIMDASFATGTSDYQSKISNYNAAYYYIDEAVEHACTGNDGKRLYNPTELQNVYNYVHTHRPSSFFVSSGYKRCMHFNTLVSKVDKIMFSSYYHWYHIDVATCYSNMSWGLSVEDPWASWPVDDDQRSDWSDMKTRYGNKFSMTWIKTSEISEFDDLFGHAKNLGLNAVWIYGFLNSDGTPASHYNDQFENISYAAFGDGFLRQKQRQYRIEWRCYLQDPCENCDPTLPDGWYIYETIPTTYTRIIEN